MLTKSDIPALLADHYKTATFPLDDIQRREVGATYWDRHHACNTIEDLRKYLISKSAEAPMCSTAYWITPSAYAGKGNSSTTWNKKGWLGADLSFDLDCDHIDGYESMSYKEQIAEMSKHTLRLVEMLENDFGAKEIMITFSGRRGFHVRVKDKEYLTLDSKQRRQIMYYIMGEKLNVMRLLKNVQFNPMKGEVSCNMYDANHPGWGGRLRKASHHLIAGVLEDEINISDIIDKHYKNKITKKDRSTIIKAFPTLTGEQRFIPKPVERFMVHGDVRALLGGKATKTLTVNFLKMMLSYTKELYGVEVDTSVTGDVRRLLRMPGGINIKQGYPCMEIGKDALEDVDLLFFLCESTLGNDEVEIKIDKPIKVQGYEDFTLDAGIHKLPMCKAMLALCQS